jgi:hypothetical protein
MAILAGSGVNADVAEEIVMHPIIEAGIMKTRTRPGRTAGRARLVWRGLPDRAAGRCGRCACRGCLLVFGPGRSNAGDLLRSEWAVAGLVPAGTSRSARMMRPLRAVRVSRDAAGTGDRARRHGPGAPGAGSRPAEGDSDG